MTTPEPSHWSYLTRVWPTLEESARKGNQEKQVEIGPMVLRESVRMLSILFPLPPLPPPALLLSSSSLSISSLPSFPPLPPSSHYSRSAAAGKAFEAEAYCKDEGPPHSGRGLRCPLHMPHLQRREGVHVWKSGGGCSRQNHRCMWIK